MLALVAAALAPSDLSPDPSWPSVSIIVPTNSRPEFVGRMLEMVAAQDYDLERLQVVVVDDSPPELRAPALAAGEQRLGAMHVIYVLLPAVVSIGEKRNVAIEHSVGFDVIAHWDDDDIYAPQRLAAQLEPLRDGSADITLLEHQAIYYTAEDELHVADMPWKLVP